MMATQAETELVLSPWHQGSRSRTGDQVDRQFVHDLLTILGDSRLLWVPGLADTTTATDKSRFARTMTYSESVKLFDTKPARRGSGTAVTFNGTDEEADTPDQANLSFGDSVVDEPFSVVALVNPANATTRTILSKHDVTTGATKREWRLFLGSSGKLELEVWDESAAATLARYYNTPISTGTWALLGASYDGSRAVTGISLYKDGLGVASLVNSSGSYVALENTASLVRLGFHQGAAAGAAFFNGKMAMVALTAKHVTADEMWATKTLANSYFGLSL